MPSANGAPTPFVVAASTWWGGDDGTWSTFEIGVGTPPQSFNVLPSTTGAEVWVPQSRACEGTLSVVSNCPEMRGVLDFQGKSSPGFQAESSSSWDLLGIYSLTTEIEHFGEEAVGYYGKDTVKLDSSTLASQTISAIVDEDIWLGSLGLGSASSNFSVSSSNIPSVLDTLRSQNATPGLSFGYTAGASYTTTKTPGSLVFGGYDQARFTPSNVSFPMSGVDNLTLAVSIKSVIADNVNGGSAALLPGGDPITAAIDSTVSQSWLPKSVCDKFADTFGLDYDNATQLYTVSKAAHDTLLKQNSSITFALGPSTGSDSTTNIVLPYAAFDLQAGIPIYNSSTYYFPIKVAQNESQQALGRHFMQEAYVFVDWERQNFTLGQAIHQGSQSNVIPVLSPLLANVTTSSHSSGLSDGAIAGIAVGVSIFSIFLAATIVILFVMRQRRRRENADAWKQELTVKYQENMKTPREVMSHQLYELNDSNQIQHEMPASMVPELQGSPHSFGPEIKTISELQGSPRNLDAQSNYDQDRESKYSREVHEVQSVYELP